MTHADLRPARRRRGPGGRTGVLATAFGLALVLALPGAALAAPGDPDASFGPDGRVVTPFPGYAEGHDIARQADGKLVVVGLSEAGFALARYDAAGGLDPGFTGDATVTGDFGGGARTANAVAIQPSDGKIVAAGKGGGGGFALVRLDSAGNLDPGLGGDGAVVAGFPPHLAAGRRGHRPPHRPPAGRQDRRRGNRRGRGGPAALQRRRQPDNGFGGGGRTSVHFPGDGGGANALARQSNGKIVAAGFGAGFAFALARYQGGDGTTPSPPPSADLSVTQTPTAAVSIGDRASYTVTVTNSAASTATATGVTLTDTLTGAGVALTSAAASQGRCTTTATGAGCSLGSLVPGASATLTAARSSAPAARTP
ncbi:hypothetical protein [Streptomyces vinaceus]|uniref:hypothetical protein n=1 Tax=Streptomyces vinaceus TaxID=1960 RepID=UPI0038202107